MFHHQQLENSRRILQKVRGGAEAAAEHLSGVCVRNGGARWPHFSPALRWLGRHCRRPVQSFRPLGMEQASESAMVRAMQGLRR